MRRFLTLLAALAAVGVVALAVIGVVSLFQDGDEGDDQADVEATLPNVDRASGAARSWAELHQRRGQLIKHAYCEYIRASLLPPLVYDCEVRYESPTRVYRLRVGDSANGKVVIVDKAKLVKDTSSKQ